MFDRREADKDLLELLPLGDPADEPAARRPPWLEAGLADQSREADGAVLAPEDPLPEIVDGEALARRPARRLVQQDLARRGLALDPRGGRHGRARHRPVEGAGNAARCGDDLAGRETDPDLQRLARGVLEIGEALADRERTVGGPKGVVVVGDRPAEDREHGIADELLTGPVEAVDRVDHRPERRIDPTADLLGVELRDEPDVVDDVGE